MELVNGITRHDTKNRGSRVASPVMIIRCLFYGNLFVPDAFQTLSTSFLPSLRIKQSVCPDFFLLTLNQICSIFTLQPNHGYIALDKHCIYLPSLYFCRENKNFLYREKLFHHDFDFSEKKVGQIWVRKK